MEVVASTLPEVSAAPGAKKRAPMKKKKGASPKTKALRKNSALLKEHSDNVTLILHSQRHWSWENLPEVLYQFRPSEGWELSVRDGVPTKPSPYPGREPILDFTVLPDRIASDVEEFKVEAWMRLDSRIRLHDIVVRMKPGLEISENTLQQRGVRFRQRCNFASWNGGNKGTSRLIEGIKERLTERGIDPALNSTRGLSPGLIDPNDPTKGRIPLAREDRKKPEVYEQRVKQARQFQRYLQLGEVNGFRTGKVATLPENVSDEDGTLCDSSSESDWSTSQVSSDDTIAADIVQRSHSPQPFIPSENSTGVLSVPEGDIEFALLKALGAPASVEESVEIVAGLDENTDSDNPSETDEAEYRGAVEDIAIHQRRPKRSIDETEEPEEPDSSGASRGGKKPKYPRKQPVKRVRFNPPSDDEYSPTPSPSVSSSQPDEDGDHQPSESDGESDHSEQSENSENSEDTQSDNTSEYTDGSHEYDEIFQIQAPQTPWSGIEWQYTGLNVLNPPTEMPPLVPDDDICAYRRQFLMPMPGYDSPDANIMFALVDPADATALQTHLDHDEYSDLMNMFDTY